MRSTDAAESFAAAAAAAAPLRTLGSVSTLNGQELEIFRAGTHAVAGKRAFTSAELKQIAQSYAEDGHEAPLVIGHPTLDAPAFGWIKSVRAEGNSLYATPHQVLPAFDQAVKDNLYKKRSAAFDKKPDGKWQLRHLGFLGSTPPVVKGLADVQFASEQYEKAEEFSTEGDGMADAQVDKKVITDSIREFFADMFPGSKDKGVPAADLQALEDRLSTKFAADIKVERDARVASETAFATYKSTHEKKGMADSAKAAVQRLKDGNLWLPAFDKMGVPELFAAVAEGNTAEFEFADGGKQDGKPTTRKQDPLTTLATIIGGFAKALPKGVVFGDEQLKEVTAVVDDKTLPANADPGSVQFKAAIEARMKQDNVDFKTAHRRLTSEGKSSASYAAAGQGAV